MPTRKSGSSPEAPAAARDADLVVKQRAAEDERWRPLGVTTDFDGLVDFAETSVTRMLTGMTRGA
jgi:hypothetical protein